MQHNAGLHQGMYCLLWLIQYSVTEVHTYLKLSTCDSFKYIMNTPIPIAFICMEKIHQNTKG